LLILSDIHTTLYLGTISFWMPFWVVFIILARELIVTSIRLVAVGEGKIVKASKWGKYKTAVTMFTIIYYLLVMPVNTQVINLIGVILVSLSVLLTVISGIDYFIKNRKFLLKSI
ncbi:MAG: hypothetical protein PQJ44_08445, partial [Sphaerochaetaceae bacterium]|nr:hypothetical protein [Sphaerochaetaceae bacterium]